MFTYSVLYASECACAHTPEAACSRAASSAGIGRVVTFTTSLLMRSYTHCKYTETHTHIYITHSCYMVHLLLKMCPSFTLPRHFLHHSPPQPSSQAPLLSDRKTKVSQFTHLLILHKYCKDTHTFNEYIPSCNVVG